MNKKIRGWTIFFLIVALLIMVRHFANQKFSSVADLQCYIKGFGFAAPFILVFFQAFQVVVPVVPGYLGCAAGAIAFGSAIGFICNYIGICLGSIMAYFLAKKYGMKVILTISSETEYIKWKTKIKKIESYEKLLFVATLLPLFPDDFLCYFSGLMRMNSKKFVWIIILGKPWCILAYSILFGLIK